MSFRAEVAGVLLINSSSPYQIDELSGRRRSYEADKRVVTSFDGKIARGSEHAVHHGWLDVVITENDPHDRLSPRCTGPAFWKHDHE
jgi:hypothetical protein